MTLYKTNFRTSGNNLKEFEKHLNVFARIKVNNEIEFFGDHFLIFKDQTFEKNTRNMTLFNSILMNICDFRCCTNISGSFAMDQISAQFV